MSRNEAMGPRECASPGVAGATLHALFWLVFGNAIGVMIAILLLLPALNPWLGEWTYGRWMMVHMNTALYGWCGLPMLGFLFTVYGADRGSISVWCRPILWLWSAALAVGSVSWLEGHSSGKLFLDWSGYARIFFPLAMVALWVLLAVSLVRTRKHAANSRVAQVTKIAGLVVLLAVPFAIYFASSPTVYPAVNPDTGGPTAASQLESSLGVVLIMLLLPFGITHRTATRTLMVAGSWCVLVLECTVCALLGRADISHHRPAQWIGLGSLLVWLPMMPAYYAAFAWNDATRKWRAAFLCWWSALVVSGWAFFLPGVLDRFKFTDGLVGHSLTAVAGFLTALLIFVMAQLLGENDAWIFKRTWSFWAWNLGVLAYVVVMTVAGWIEGGDPAFTIVPGAARNGMYVMRLLTGVAMLAASIDWFVAALSLPNLTAKREPVLAGATGA